MMNGANCTTCNREPEPVRFSKQAVFEIISNTSGCDGSDEYARGWDAACGVIWDVVERLEESTP